LKIQTSLCAAAVAALLLPACATVTRGTSQKYAIETEPFGADVALSTGQTCVSPCQLKLKRKEGFTATISKAGFETAKAEVRSKMSGGGITAGAGNLLIGGVIGGIVDGSNGSLKSLTPNPLKVKLIPAAGASAAASATPAVAEAPAPAPAAAPAPADQPKPKS
jgi:hypothetical protein